MIKRDTPIIEVLRLHPAAQAIFARHGMGCIGCMGSTNETVENAALNHDIDVETLLNELNNEK
jgi:hybrid cluster-associated redox disulfide protein